MRSRCDVCAGAGIGHDGLCAPPDVAAGLEQDGTSAWAAHYLVGMAKALVEDVAHAMIVESGGADRALVDLASSTLRSLVVSKRGCIRHGNRWGSSCLMEHLAKGSITGESRPQPPAGKALS
ncbi:DUF3077 domain-containing protein [Pseudomonas sp. NPDC087612]|uniref:DUF3077 domain-containing protein n=1 Tax=Pseudomonas sp. NPDC087612 TaxID=3364441 RepID=UPI003806887A